MFFTIFGINLSDVWLFFFNTNGKHFRGFFKMFRICSCYRELSVLCQWESSQFVGLIFFYLLICLQIYFTCFFLKLLLYFFKALVYEIIRFALSHCKRKSAWHNDFKKRNIIHSSVLFTVKSKSNCNKFLSLW